jgi:glutathione S-transferase
VPAIVRPLVGSLVRGRVKKMLWKQGVLRYSHEDIIKSALRDWRAVLTAMSDGPFFFGDEPTGVDAIVFGALATSVLTPIESPIRDFLRSQPPCVAYAERMHARFFPDLASGPSREAAAQAKASTRVVAGRRLSELPLTSA